MENFCSTILIPIGSEDIESGGGGAAEVPRSKNTVGILDNLTVNSPPSRWYKKPGVGLANSQNHQRVPAFTQPLLRSALLVSKLLRRHTSETFAMIAPGGFDNLQADLRERHFGNQNVTGENYGKAHLNSVGTVSWCL